MRIKKCTCGGNASIPQECYDDEGCRFVSCEKCGKESLQWHSGNDAIRNWNKINTKAVGRPKLPDSELKKNHTCKFTDLVWLKIGELAEMHGISRNEYLEYKALR